MAQLLARQPELTQRNMRPVQVGNLALGGLLSEGLTAAGMPA